MDEKRLVRAAVETGKAVFGVCLGAQMIASALGARVYRAPEEEIGWFPVRRVTAKGLGAVLPELFTPLHRHGETFDLPTDSSAGQIQGCEDSQEHARGHSLSRQVQKSARARQPSGGGRQCHPNAAGPVVVARGVTPSRDG